MPKLLNRRGLVLGGVITLLVAGSAFAFSTAGGSGTGPAAMSGGSSALMANQSTVLTAMFPGGATQTMGFRPQLWCAGINRHGEGARLS